MKTPAHAPGNLFASLPRVLLSQGMTRPGIVHGQHWGRLPRVPLPPGPPCLVPESYANLRLSNQVLR